MNKKAGIVAVLLCILLMTAGCGTGSKKESGEGAAPSASAQAPSTKIYKDANGKEVEIPENPQRVISSDFLSEVLALGVVPVAAHDTAFEEPLTKELVKGLPKIGTWPPNLEAISAADPDLIIVADYTDAETDGVLSKIAPTVAVNYSDNVFERERTIAKILGKQEKAEQVISAYQEKLEQARQRLKPFVQEGATAVTMRFVKNQLLVFSSKSGEETLYTPYGFTAPLPVQEISNSDQPFFAMISMETLPKFAADYMFVVAGRNEEEQQSLKELQESPIWKGLPAVKNNRVYVVPEDWIKTDLISMNWQLDEAVRMLEKSSR
ncbi:ABC transporter substrate-binding protein [Paenibacillus sp. GCM10012306]|uniref:ABC transporter substrate-binding protein n=1 Tax=Paenibacillus sp. GCM10012306 TaxID=3317342 RepID=UPI00360B0C7E